MCPVMKEEEFADHLFVHCAIANMVWGFFLPHLKIYWSFPNHFYELASGWWIGALEGPLTFGHTCRGLLVGPYGRKGILRSLRAR